MQPSPQSIDPTGEAMLPTVFFDELTHRVANVFQLATGVLSRSMLRGADNGPAAAETLGLLNAHATVYRVLCQGADTECVDAGRVLASLCDAIQLTVAGDLPITVEVDTWATVVPAKVARVLALLVNELVMNAVKHAFGPVGGKVHVVLRSDKNVIRCTVSDTGLGLQGVNPPRRGCGMGVIERLAQCVGATCAWHFSDCGTTATVSIRAYQAAPRRS